MGSAADLLKWSLDAADDGLLADAARLVDDRVLADAIRELDADELARVVRSSPSLGRVVLVELLEQLAKINALKVKPAPAEEQLPVEEPSEGPDRIREAVGRIGRRQPGHQYRNQAGRETDLRW